MTDSERWARWTLGVVVLTVAAWVALVAWRGNRIETIAAFSLLCLTAIPRNSRRHFIKGGQLDEREQAITDKALLAGLRAVWLALCVIPLAAAFSKGWTGTLSLPVWALALGAFWAAMLALTVQSVTILVLYRR